MHDNNWGLLKAWGICLLSGLLLSLSFPARAATNITSLTASPSSVTVGDVVAFDITVITTARETPGGLASGVLSRDGVVVRRAEFPGLLDRTIVGDGVIQASLPVDPSLYSAPGVYELVVRISGEEDGQVPFSDSATTAFAVTDPAPPPVDVVVSPSALSITGAPGETATGAFTIAQGTGPFTAQPANTDLGSVDNPSSDVGESVCTRTARFERVP